MQPISSGLVVLVLAAAALHAGWNALIKARLEPLIAMTLVVIGSGLAGVPLLLAFGMAPPAAWPYGWSRSAGQFGGFAKLGSVSLQAANFVVSIPPTSVAAYASSGVSPPSAE